jgi:hypothetical protein
MNPLARAELTEALGALGELLEARGLHYEVVVIGGGNLILRGLVSRPTTKDVDLLGEWTLGGVRRMSPLPESFGEAIADVGRTYDLAPDWINPGPESLLDFGLPEGFADRLERLDLRGLVIWFAGRFDMVCFKLYAAVDQAGRGRHAQDLRELEPTTDELLVAARWTTTHDPSPGFRADLVSTLGDLGMEDADARLG